MSREITITALRKGTVLDHIPAEHTFKVAEILEFDKMRSKVVIAANLESKKLGLKGLIKLDNVFLDKTVVQKIAVIAPRATMSRIEDFKVTEKTKLERPKLLSGIIKCFNPNCITNSEPVVTRFVVERENPLSVRCRYCEREMSREEIELL